MRLAGVLSRGVKDKGGERARGGEMRECQGTKLHHVTLLQHIKAQELRNIRMPFSYIKKSFPELLQVEALKNWKTNFVKLHFPCFIVTVALKLFCNQVYFTCFSHTLDTYDLHPHCILHILIHTQQTLGIRNMYTTL